MKFQDFQGTTFWFSRNKITDLTYHIIIIFQILINKLIQQNGTNKVEHMQIM